MTQDEIIEMAEQAGMVYMDYIRVDSMEQIERLVNLVAAKATEEANAKAKASWTLMCKKMVAIEREACAKVCDEVGEYPSLTPQHCAESIRARGEQA